MKKNLENKPHLVFEGERFSRLVVLKFSHKDKRHRRHYLVRCDCGKEKTVQGTLLRSGNTRSCGCLSREQKKSKRIPLNHSEITAVILGYKRHAKSRGYIWDLPRGEVESLIKQNCFYCGSTPSNIQKTKNTTAPLVYNGIDRKDNKKGYCVENVVPCCSICNRAKGNLDYDSWIRWCRIMAEQWG